MASRWPLTVDGGVMLFEKTDFRAWLARLDIASV